MKTRPQKVIAMYDDEYGTYSLIINDARGSALRVFSHDGSTWYTDEELTKAVSAELISPYEIDTESCHGFESDD